MKILQVVVLILKKSFLYRNHIAVSDWRAEHCSFMPKQPLHWPRHSLHLGSEGGIEPRSCLAHGSQNPSNDAWACHEFNAYVLEG
jgi:hypothetical protein